MRLGQTRERESFYLQSILHLALPLLRKLVEQKAFASYGSNTLLVDVRQVLCP